MEWYLVAVSTLCEELSLQPTVFYRWQKVFFEKCAAAFQVLAVLMDEYVALKEHAVEVRK